MNGNQKAAYGILTTWTDIMRRWCGCRYCDYRVSAMRRGPGANALATAARLKGQVMIHMKVKHQAELKADGLG